MNIKSSDLVLEIGSGDKPCPRADVLLDKFPRRALAIDRPMVIADAEVLPFADKSFGYIIASHVLEHAENPAKFLDELSRVGKRGYIETPSLERERVFDWLFHRWYVYQKDKALVLVKKTKKSKKFFAGMNDEKRKELFCLDGKKLLNPKFEWQGKINYKIIYEEPDAFLENLDKILISWQKSIPKDKPANLIHSNILRLKNNLFQFKWGFKNFVDSCKREKKVDLFSLLVCPACKGKLISKKEELVCLPCIRRFYFYKGNVPILL